MREIKFRTWNKSEDKMYYNAELTYDFGMNGSNVMEESFGSIITNDDFILMQYTGFKDKNGREVYEGDIVDYFLNEKSIITYGNGSFIIKSKNYIDCMCSMYGEVEVLGNRFEDPELLKGVEQH